MSSSWTLRVSFEGMTWGDLRKLVRRADIAGFDDDEDVEFYTDDELRRVEIEGR